MKPSPGSRLPREHAMLPPFAPAAEPRVLWIELSSRCPFDCVFCSRRLRRGGGLHMDMDLYRRLVTGLHAPQIIRLNYSGESIHHPQLVEAIRLAVATGAVTELVTALASLPERLVEPLATSGLQRLTLSLHTLDADQYGAIYGHGTLDDVRRRVALLLAARDAAGLRTPTLDIAVVAMRRNLDQLLPIADFAARSGAAGLAVHPVIRRDEIPEPFADELDGQRLRPAFINDLCRALDAVRARHPELPLSVSTPETRSPRMPDACPLPWPGPLPEGTCIHSCDQNPWETVHVLADGSLVTCEVRDHLVLGRLDARDGPGLRDLWQAPAYTAFRHDYRLGRVPECHDCAYKTVFRPGPAAARIDATGTGQAQLQRGWHAADGGGLLWAQRSAAFALARAQDARQLRLRGLVPGGAGRIGVAIDGVAAGWLGDGDGHDTWVDTGLALPPGDTDWLVVTLDAERVWVPARDGTGSDSRELGFGLTCAEVA